MQDDNLSREELLAELGELRRRVAESEAQGARPSQWVELVEQVNALKEDLLARGSLDEKVKRITDGLVKIFGCEFARIWVTKPGDRCDSDCVHAKVTEGPHVCRQRNRCLHLMVSSGRYTHIDGELHRRVPFDCYKIGRIASGAEPRFLTNDVANDPRIHNQIWARELGLVSFAGYRLLSDDLKPIGVMALFAKQFISPDEEAMLEDLANTTSQVVQAATVDEAWRESEERFKQVAECADEWIWEVDADCLYRYCSSAVEKILGYSPDELVGQKHFYDLFAPEVREDLKEATLVAFERREIFRAFVNANIHKNGNIIILNTSGTPVLDKKGNLLGYRGVDRDITERKKTEDSLRRNEERFRSLIDQAADAIFVHDFDGRFLEVNRQACTSLGYTRDELLSMSVDDVDPDAMPRGDRAKFWPNLPATLEARHRRKDGAIFPVEVRLGAIEYGETKVLLAMARDLTDRKKAEEALRESEAKYRAIFLGASEGILVADPLTTEFKYANPVVCDMLGYTEDELIGLSVSAIHPKETLEYVIAEFQAIARGGKSKAKDIPCLRKDGTIFYANIGGASITIDGLPCNVGFFSDITDRKKAEDALRESEDRYRQVTENSLTGIFIHQDGVGVYVNQRLADILDYTKEEMIGGQFLKVVHPEDREMVAGRALARLNDELTPAVYELRLLRKTGETIWCEVLATRIEYRGHRR